MDRILIRGLAVETRIGLIDWERKVDQRLSLDIDLLCDITPAANSDKLELSIDYAAVAEMAIAFGRRHQFFLIEAFAEQLVGEILGEYPRVLGVRLLLRKPGAVADADWVGVEIERTR